MVWGILLLDWGLSNPGVSDFDPQPVGLWSGSGRAQSPTVGFVELEGPPLIPKNTAATAET